MNVLDPVTQHHVRQAAEALTDEFAGVYSQETIERFIAESLDLLGDARINVFVPVIAHRFARERLKALGQAEGRMAKEFRRCSSSVFRTPADRRWRPAY